MKHVLYFQSEALKFPWARIEWDGSFNHDLLKARMGVLGYGADFGYWSVPGGMRSHDGAASTLATMKDPVFGLAMRKPRKKPYTHGEIMLKKEWPKEIDSWKLKDEKDVPRLFFTKDSPPPKKPTYGQVKDWESWYAWRGLEMKSPAALLMDFPLSVYHLLTKILDVVNPESTPSKRQTLRVHYVGVELELDFLPLFSELALLLPNTDLTLIFFGKVVHDLVITARKRYPGSLATKDTVWNYTAPKETGGGSISIKLWAEAELWTRAVLDAGEYPDAIVAINAGLCAYESWADPILITAAGDIPFAITEYAEQSTDLCAAMLPKMLQSWIPMINDQRSAMALSKSRSYEATINPFHRPGQRSIPFFRVPNVYNGFAMPVVTTAR
ncbi:uncharacterized protein LACBIDRAFT_304320 [Laccaria bicolor S238N-H82]|uniref:Predicted protein n=1 Tax=Laccaria bicolor (strain S238N-H82 / ATCC MYA-4686) TaxID=486041 RepID=B0DLD6_LACBS|nr:uncharacterized protein LACBIDRAFT_304320 [Laccaria bicolor S238N-H82]EDR04547.1 predicted protein [Laccaria bicolor S238N-H82]|eukprot:XP_001884719.1 predicted protein [Laccaria bicolor S238N-H82]